MTPRRRHVMPASLPAHVGGSRHGRRSARGPGRGGNQEAFAALYERYYGPLLGYCRSILLDVEDADDAAQSALESELRALPAVSPAGPCARGCIGSPTTRRSTSCAGAGPQVDAGARLSETHRSRARGRRRAALTRLSQLVDDLRTLPARQRGALVMRELNGLGYEEIGDALGICPDGARRAVFDARSALHDVVDGRATECIEHPPSPLRR